MKCPFCLQSNTFVKNSRDTEDGNVVRRRRICISCKRRFTTLERIQLRELIVIKRSGIKKPFDRDKLYKSISASTNKRNISDEVINNITNKIVLELENDFNDTEITTETIGELVMRELAKVDPVAYIRFASVYMDFSNIQDFSKFINKIKVSKTSDSR